MKPKYLLETRQCVLAEEAVDLWKCATMDLMSDEKSIVDRVSGRIVRPPSFHSKELTAVCAHNAVGIRGESKAEGNAEEMSEKQTEFSLLPTALRRQTDLTEL